LRRMLLGITQAFTPVSKSMTDAAKNLAQDSGLPPGSCPGDPRCGELPSQQPPPPPPSGCDDPVMRQDLPCMIIGTRGDLAYTPIR
jgi:hypothetical protein